jgi:hypothetical protein
MLHLTKVAFGCDSYEMLAARIAARETEGSLKLTTRYRPKRHEEITGGSLFWILKHRLVGRCEILGFEDADAGRTHIVLNPQLIPVDAIPRRAHQGWRYLAAADAPFDISDASWAMNDLPRDLNQHLAELGLV